MPGLLQRDGCTFVLQKKSRVMKMRTQINWISELQEEIICHRCRRFDIKFQPIHGFLSEWETKLSSNISLETCSPDSQNPTSFATISALSLICSMLWGSVHNLFTSCSLLCFPTAGISHFMYSISLSSSVSFELTLLARYSLSCLRALMLRVHHAKNGQKIIIFSPFQREKLILL